jgi:hypothetical protein
MHAAAADRAAATRRLNARVEAMRSSGKPGGAVAEGAAATAAAVHAAAAGGGGGGGGGDVLQSLQRRVQGVSVWEKEMHALRSENVRLRAAGGSTAAAGPAGGGGGALAAIAQQVESQLLRSETRMAEHAQLLSSPARAAGATHQRGAVLSSPVRRSVEEIDRSRALVRQVEQLNQQLQLSVRLRRVRSNCLPRCTSSAVPAPCRMHPNATRALTLPRRRSRGSWISRLGPHLRSSSLTRTLCLRRRLLNRKPSVSSHPTCKQNSRPRVR